MSIRRLGESATRSLASRCARLYRLALTLLAICFREPLVHLRNARHRRQHRLLHEGTLCRLELGLYHVIIVPLVAFLPAPLAYGIACLQGKLRYRLDRSKREYIMHGLEGTLGDQMSLAERIQVTRDYFRLRSCE